MYLTKFATNYGAFLSLYATAEHMHRYHDKQFLHACQTIDCSQLLHATFLETFQSQISANNAVHRGMMNGVLINAYLERLSDSESNH